MPTVIDELVVRLGLDSSDFNEAEHRLVASLRRMEAAATRGGQQVTSSVGKGTIDLFRTIENPIAGLRRHFEAMVVSIDQPRERLRQLGEQGRRTGEDVERGALAGATGLRTLGVAGLAAFTAYEVLNKSLSAVGDVAGRVFATGLGASAAGMGINEFGAISQALFAHNVPQEETQNWLAQYSEMQWQASRGMPQGVGYATNLNQRLAQAGLSSAGIDPFHDSPEEMAAKLARAYAGMPEREAYGAGSAIGQTRQMVHGLREEGGNLLTSVARERGRAPTPEQQSSAERLIEAENKLAIAWESLYRSIMLSGLADALTRFANWLNELISPGGILSAPPKPGAPGYWLDEHGNVAPATTRGVGPQSSGGADTIISTARAAGANESATSVILSAAMGEGGIGADSWKPGDHGTSFGHWQLHQGGELDRYVAEGNQPGDAAAQTRYVLRRLNEIMPGFSTSTDTTAQVRAITQFERSIQGPEYYASGLDKARQLIAASKSPQPQLPSGQSPQPQPPSGLSPETEALQKQHPDWFENGVYVGHPEHPLRSWETNAPRADLSAIRQASAMPSATTNHNYGDVNLNGDIVVHAPTREGGAIANSVSDQVRQLTPLATPANTGLE